MFFPLFGKRPSLAPATPPRIPCIAVWGMLLACSAFATAAQKNTPTPMGAARSIRLEAPPAIDSSAPAPDAPQEIDPPLSIFESCQLLDRVTRTLAGKAVPTTSTLRQADRVLATVLLYAERMDRANPTLPFYAWETVSADKAPKAGWDTQVFKLASPIPQVTALAVRARHGDMEIRIISAIDTNATKWDFSQSIIIPADQPRPEFFFLPLPTQLTEVRVTCRQKDPKAPRWGRLLIEAGISSVPETAKQANYYLQLARADLKSRRLPEARRNIYQARELLKEYQKSRRL